MYNNEQRHMGITVVILLVYAILVTTTLLMKTTLNSDDVSQFSKVIMFLVWGGLHFCVFTSAYYLIKRVDEN